jgi:SAM-dependent methyltransferase
MLVKRLVGSILRPNGKVAFLSELPPRARILDVGCGNNSPYNVKRILPECEYTGIDVGDYNQSKPNLADRYIVSSAEDFTNEILKLGASFDAVLSSHNLEHCDDRGGTFAAMLGSLRAGGRLYLAFPCEQSVRFPRRRGTLNYFDDATHKLEPPRFDELIADLKRNNFRVIFATRRHRPKILWLLGLICEPVSRASRKVLRGTWEYYGFESVICAEKLQ